MLKLSYKTDMPAGDQIDCYLSCNIRINKGELKKKILIHLYRLTVAIMKFYSNTYSFKGTISPSIMNNRFSSKTKLSYQCKCLVQPF